MPRPVNRGFIESTDGDDAGWTVYSIRISGYKVVFQRGYIEFSPIIGHRSDNSIVSYRINLDGEMDAEPTGRRVMGHTTNQLIGNVRSGWITDATSFNEVVYEGLWGGIYLRYYIDVGELKYDLTVPSWVDPAAIRLSYSGVNDLTIDIGSGDLVIDTPFGIVLDRRPISYQVIDGRKEFIESSFSFIYEHIVTFQVADQDPSHPLVIDPTVNFFTYAGGTTSDIAEAIAVDSSGSTYVAGYTYSNDFPTTTGAFSREFTNNTDVFVVKLLPDGTGLSYATYIGGDSFDRCYDMVVDDQGCVYLCGGTFSEDFPTTEGVYNETMNGVMDVFVIKLDANGSDLMYSTFIGGTSGTDRAYSIEIDGQGNAYVTGMTVNDDFPTTNGAFDEEHNGDMDGFLFGIGPNGTVLLFSTFMGGGGEDIPTALAVDLNGDIVVTGSTDSNDFPVTDGSYDTEHGGGEDAFVLRMNRSGDTLKFSTFLGKGGSDIAKDVCLNRTGCPVITGYTNSPQFPTTAGSFDTVLSGPTDAFVSMLDSEGSSLVMSTFVGGRFWERADSISISDNGSIFISGSTVSDDHPTTGDAFDGSHNGGSDAVVFELSEDGTSLLYSTFIGGSRHELDMVLSLGPKGRLNIAGTTGSDDFPISTGVFDVVGNGGMDIFVLSLDPSYSGTLPPSAPTGVDVVGREKSVNITWQGPTTDGGLPVMDYIIYRGTSNSSLFPIIDFDGVSFNWTDSPRRAGVTYHYSVTARNTMGEGPMSIIVNATPWGQPEAPLNFTATPGCGTVLIEWSMPLDIGDLPPLGLRLYRGDNSTVMDPIADLSPGSLQWKDLNLENGRSYFYSICVYNGRGNGSLSDVVHARPRGPPSAPQEFTGTPGDGGITLNWSWPSEDGGSLINGFVLFRGLSEGSMGVHVELITSLFHLDEGLVNGVTYFYSVMAFNEVGNGTMSTTLSMTPVGPPDPPQGLNVSENNGLVTLTWEPPASDGGSRINGFNIHRSSDGTIFILVARVGLVYRYEDDDLVNGVTYSYYVTAFNAIDSGPPTVTLLVFPRSHPGRPTIMDLFQEVDGVTLRWNSPSDWGGASALRYKVLRGGDLNAMSTIADDLDVEEYLDTDISLAGSVHYAVVAYNTVGDGPPSHTMSINIVIPPGVCQGLTVVEGDGFVLLSWSPPVDEDGSAVTGYNVQRGVFITGIVKVATSRFATEYNDTGVDNGQTYYYVVVAFNSMGPGPMTPVVNATPRGPPSPPDDLKAITRGGEVHIGWSQSPGQGAVVTGYILFRRDSSDEIWNEIAIDGLNMEYVDSEVRPGRTYYYKVVALSGSGASEASRMVDVTFEGDGDRPLWSSVLLIPLVLASMIMALVVRRWLESRKGTI